MVEIMSDLKSSEIKGFEEYFDKLKEHAVKALKEKKGIQHHFDMAKMYGQKAFFGRSRHDCNRMIINAAVASYLAKICDDEI